MSGCGQCGFENPDYARFCMGCGAGLLVICPSCGDAIATGARFCPSCGVVISSTVGSGEEMIKLVTILFADVVGSTAQAERMDPEETRALMAEFFETMSAEIRAEGGTIERFIGDAIMAVFGIPVTHEDDQVRAVRAARRMLEMLDVVNADRRPDARVQIRVGINTGAVSAGGSLGQQLLVMGDAVNIAARLQQITEPNTIIIGERTARAVGHIFELRELDPLAVKGKTFELSAFLVEAERSDPDSAIRRVPLVGRNADMQILDGAFARVVESSRPHLVAVVGEPGVGKSRLTLEFVEQLDLGDRVVLGRCLPHGTGTTLGPLRDILRQKAGLIATDDPEAVLKKISALVGDVPPHLAPEPDRMTTALASTLGVEVKPDEVATLDPREVHRELVEAWRVVFTHLSSEGPSVVVIEDLHWADAATLEVLDELVERVSGAVLFLCPTRPERLTSHGDWMAALRNYSILKLEPLTPRDSEHLASLLLEIEDLPSAFTSELLERAEGYPFFLEEITNRLIDEGFVSKASGTWAVARDIAEVEIPDNIQTLVLARLDLLSPEERSIIQHAAVLGRTFWPSAIAHLVAADGIEEILTTLTRRQLIMPSRSSFIPDEDEYVFKHVLICDVAYETLPKQARARAHAGAAAWIERTRGERADEVAELLAHHYQLAASYGADDSMRVKARDYSLMAARQALGRFAVRVAEDLGRQAVSLSAGSAERIEALEALGDLYVLTANGDGAWSTFVEVINEIGQFVPSNIESLARVAAKAAIIPTRWEGLMHSVVAKDDIDSVIEIGLEVSGEASRERALLLASRAFLQAAGYEERNAAGEQAAKEALDIAEQVGDADLLSATLDATASWFLADGRYGAHDRVTRQRMQMIPDLHDLNEILDIYGVAAYVAVQIGRYEDAAAAASACIERARGIDVSNYLQGSIWRAQALFMLGDWDGALRDQIEIESLDNDPSMNVPASNIRSYGITLLIKELRGEETDVRRYLKVVRKYQADTVDSGLTFAAPLAMPARALAHAGAVEEARSWLHLDRGIYLGSHLEAMCEVVAAQEDWDTAAEIVPMAREEAERGELLALPLFADRLDGRSASALGDPERAARMLQRSAEGFKRLEARWEHAWSNLLLGEVLLDADPGRARLVVQDAAATFRDLRSVQEEERAAKVLAQI